MKIGRLGFFLGALAAAPWSHANPDGGMATSGEVLIEALEGTTTISQLSERAIVHWDSFSISPGEVTQFLQPSATSAILNRVTGSGISGIHGTLTANGSVYLINPNGVVIGPGGRVDVGGSFVASALNLPDAEFLAGGDMRFSGGGAAAVTNLGTVLARQGDVFLIGPGSVSNQGTIEAPGGTVGMGAGTQVLVMAEGNDERLFVEVGSPEGVVDQAGTIRAAQAELKALGSDPEALAVNVSGLVEATGVAREGGRILLTAGGGGANVSGRMKATRGDGAGGEVRIFAAVPVVEDTAVIDASGSDGGLVSVVGTDAATVRGRLDASADVGAGGRVEIFAPQVIVESPAVIDASGPDGGGIVLLGGDLFSDDTSLALAESAEVGAGARVRADGTGGGNGGRIGVFSSGMTTVGGELSAGGLGTGDGGRIDIFGGDAVTIGEGALLDASGANGGTVSVDSEGETSVYGTIHVGGLALAGTGGRIQVTGKDVTVGSSALIDASGGGGGGEVLVGGGEQGGDPAVRNAKNTTVQSGAVLAAEALVEGGGGRVVTWADIRTHFGGLAKARAAGPDGDGGFIEISGKRELVFTGSVDASSQGGAAGTVLFDPFSNTTQQGTAGVTNDPALLTPTSSGNPAGTTGVDNGDGPGLTYTFSDVGIQDALAANNVFIQASFSTDFAGLGTSFNTNSTNDLTVESTIANGQVLFNAGGAFTHGGNFTTEADLISGNNVNVGGTFTIDANQTISLNKVTATTLIINGNASGGITDVSGVGTVINNNTNSNFQIGSSTGGGQPPGQPAADVVQPAADVVQDPVPPSTVVVADEMAAPAVIVGQGNPPAVPPAAQVDPVPDAGLQPNDVVPEVQGEADGSVLAENTPQLGPGEKFGLSLDGRIIVVQGGTLRGSGRSDDEDPEEDKDQIKEEELEEENEASRRLAERTTELERENAERASEGQAETGADGRTRVTRADGAQNESGEVGGEFVIGLDGRLIFQTGTERGSQPAGNRGGDEAGDNAVFGGIGGGEGAEDAPSASRRQEIRAAAEKYLRDRAAGFRAENKRAVEITDAAFARGGLGSGHQAIIDLSIQRGRAVSAIETALAEGITGETALVELINDTSLSFNSYDVVDTFSGGSDLQNLEDFLVDRGHLKPRAAGGGE